MLSSIGSFSLLSIELSSIFSIQILCLCYLSSYLKSLIEAYFNGTDAFFAQTIVTQAHLISASLPSVLTEAFFAWTDHRGSILVQQQLLVFFLCYLSKYFPIFTYAIIYLYTLFLPFIKLSSIVNRSTLQLYIIYSCLVI